MGLRSTVSTELRAITVCSRARVYGWAGSRKIERASARSTTYPAYITFTSSAACATTPRSWEMSSRAMSRSS